MRSEMASYIALMGGLRCSHISTNCTACILFACLDA